LIFMSSSGVVALAKEPNVKSVTVKNSGFVRFMSVILYSLKSLL
jgi:hypothetical protein